MGVVAIWRYPIKAMLGQALSVVGMRRCGVVGDRCWVVVDRATGKRIANKRGRTDPRLRACRAELAGEDDLASLRITLPDGSMASGAEAEDALSELLETTVALERADTDGGELGVPSAHHDFAPLHLLTTGTLAVLRGAAPACDWDVRRFRPNLVLDDGPAPEAFAEDALLGSELRARSGLRIRVAIPTPRCVVPTRGIEELPADPQLLRTVARRHLIDLGPFGRAACLGVYAEVSREGSVGVGDRLEVAAGRLSPTESLRATLGALAARLDLSA